MTEKKASTEETSTYIIMSGKHRHKDGKLYQVGDIIELTQEMALKIRDKISTVSEFEARIEAFERNESLEEKAAEILKPPEDPRDPESLARAEQIVSMKKSNRHTIGL